MGYFVRLLAPKVANETHGIHVECPRGQANEGGDEKPAPIPDVTVYGDCHTKGDEHKGFTEDCEDLVEFGGEVLSGQTQVFLGPVSHADSAKENRHNAGQTQRVRNHPRGVRENSGQGNFQEKEALFVQFGVAVHHGNHDCE